MNLANASSSPLDQEQIQSHARRNCFLLKASYVFNVFKTNCIDHLLVLKFMVKCS